MRIGTIVFVIAACALVVGGGCASSPEPLSKLIYARAPSSPDQLLPGPQLWGLAFDAREADFDDWVDDFEQKVHHNWVLSTYFGYGGRVQLGFVVEENGTVTAIEVLEATATQPLVDAAREALARSRLEPLPDDFDRARVSMQVTCVYGPPPGE